MERLSNLCLHLFLVTTMRLVFKHDCVRSKEARDSLGSGQSCFQGIFRGFSENSGWGRGCSLSLSCCRSWSLSLCGNLWAGLSLRRRFGTSSSWLHDRHGLAEKAAKTARTFTTLYSLDSFHDFASHVKHLCHIHATCKSTCELTCKSAFIAFLWFHFFGVMMFLGGSLWSIPFTIWVFTFFLGRRGIVIVVVLGLIVAVIRIFVRVVASVVGVGVIVGIVVAIVILMMIIVVIIVWIASIIALPLLWDSDAKHAANRGHSEKFLRIFRPGKLCQSLHCRFKTFIGVIWDAVMASFAAVDLVS